MKYYFFILANYAEIQPRMSKQLIIRSGGPKRFSYSLSGQPVQSKTELAYIRSLRIPPAWQEVRIAKNKRSKVLAQGLDAKGRVQSIYHPAFRAKQEQAKFERVLRFARALPALRSRTEHDLQHKTLDKEKVLACILQIMDRTYMRVGNETYAKENQSYGLTTLRSKHTTVKNDQIIFDFDGKSGKHHHKIINDKRLAKIVKQLDDMPGYEIFRYYGEDGKVHDISSSDVNAYIKEIMGDEFSAKDFRTWAGTITAAGVLANTERANNEKERKKALTTCVKHVAKKLGNTPAIARSSYIDPSIFNVYLAGDDLHSVWSAMKDIKQTQHMSSDEQCVMKMLEA